jgi:hypothetical protein
MKRKKTSSALLSGQTTSGRYVNLILIILTIFIALIRRKNAELSTDNSTMPQTSISQEIATYTFSDTEHQSAEWLALATLLKSHDIGAEVTISSRSRDSRAIAEVTKYLDDIGVPFDAYKVLGKVGPREEISVAVYRIGRSKT